MATTVAGLRFVTPALVARPASRSVPRAAAAPAKIGVGLTARGRTGPPARASPVVRASSRDACDARRTRVLSAGNDEGDAIGSPAEAPAPRFAWLGQFAKVAALAARGTDRDAGRATSAGVTNRANVAMVFLGERSTRGGRGDDAAVTWTPGTTHETGRRIRTSR